MEGIMNFLDGSKKLDLVALLQQPTKKILDQDNW